MTASTALHLNSNGVISQNAGTISTGSLTVRGTTGGVTRQSSFSQSGQQQFGYCRCAHNQHVARRFLQRHHASADITAGTLSLGVSGSGSVTAGIMTIGTAVGTAGQNLNLSAIGGISIGANVTGSTVDLRSTSNSISQTAGSINATSVILAASTGIGTNANPIQTAATNLQFTNTTGGTHIRNTGALTINGVSNFGSGGGKVSAGSPLTVAAAVSSAADFVLEAEGDGGTNSTLDNLTINASITHTGAAIVAKSITLRAADDVIFQNGLVSFTNTNAMDTLTVQADSAAVATPDANLTGSITFFGGTINFGSGTANFSTNTGAGVGAILGNAAAGTDVTAGTISFSAATGIGSTNAIETEATNLTVDNTASGNVQILEATGVTIATYVRNQAAGGTLSVVTTNGSINTAAATTSTNNGMLTLDANGASADVTVGTGGLASGGGAIRIEAGPDVTISQATTTQGGNVDIDAARNISSLLAGSITTTAATNGTNSRAIDIDAAGTGTISLLGNLTTSGLNNGAGNGDNAGIITVDTDNGTISVAQITANGGNDIAAANNGGNAAAVTLTAGGANTITLNGNVSSNGGTGGTAGTGADNTDIQLNFVPAGGTLLSDAGDSDPLTYVLTAWNVPEGTLQIDQIINASGIRDRGGNAVVRTRQGASGSHVYKVDRTAPTPVISSPLSPGPTNADSIPISVNFGEGVFGIEQSDLVVTNGTVSNFASTDFQTFTFNVTPLANGLVTIDIAAAAANDPALNNSNAATQFAITSRRVKAAITRMDPTPTLATSVRFHVNFSEGVTNVDAADFVVATTGSASGNVLVVVDDAGDTNASTWVVKVTGVSRHGTVGLDFAPATDIRGVAFNTPITLAPTVDEVYDVINDARSILSQPARTAGNVVATVSGLNLFLTRDASDNGISISARADGAVVWAGMGGITINGVAQFVAFSAVGGIAPGSVTVFKSGGRDFVSVADITVAGNLTVFAGDGVSAIDLRNVNVTGNTVLKEKAGDGFIDVNGGTFTGVASIFGGAGNNTIVVNNANFRSVLSIQSGDDNDSITLNNVSVTGSTSISTQAGNDQITLTNTVHLSTLYLLTAAGNDTIIGNNVDVTLTTYIATDAGNDIVDLNDLHAMSTAVLILGDGNDAAGFLNSRFDGLVNIPISAGSNVVDIQGTTFNGSTYLQASGGELGVRIKNNTFKSGVILKGGPGSRDALLNNGSSSFAVPPVVSSFERMSLTHIDSQFENLLGLLFPYE